MASGELIVPKGSVAAAVHALIAGLPDVPHYSGVGTWATRIASTSISSKLPDATGAGIQTLPSAFIRVTRTGGGMLNRVTDRATLLVECYHDGGDGEPLANAAIAVLGRAAGQQQRYAGAFLRGLDNVYGPTDFPDPLVPSHDRAQFTCDLLVSTN